MEEFILNTGEVRSELAKSSFSAVLSMLTPADDILMFADITAFRESLPKKPSSAEFTSVNAFVFVLSEGLSGVSVTGIVVSAVYVVLFPAHDASMKMLTAASMSASNFFIKCSLI